MRLHRVAWTLALVAVAVPASAQARRAAAAAQPDFKAMVQRYWDVWGAGDLDKAAAMYAKDSDLVFYDLEPLKYNGWDRYRQGVVPNILAKFEKVAFHLNDDLKATRRGNVAWTTVTAHASGKLKTGAPVETDMRHTVIWEKRGPDWLIVHEHVSAPSSLPSPPPGR
jgi:ketosteroid isomerase-like protein